MSIIPILLLMVPLGDPQPPVSIETFAFPLPGLAAGSPDGALLAIPVVSPDELPIELVDDPMKHEDLPELSSKLTIKLIPGEPVEDPVLKPVRWPVRVFDVASRPIREANFLLPRQIDPFYHGKDVPWVWAGEEEESTLTEAGFKPSEQARLLSTRLANRVDTPDSAAVWHWQIQSGGSFRQGNVATTNGHAQFQAERRSIRSFIQGKTGAIYNDDRGGNTNLKSTTEGLIDRNLRGHWIWFGRETLEYDQARLIDLRSVTATGLGFKFIDELNCRLVARSGPTVSYILYDALANTPDEVRSGWLIEAEYRKLLFDAFRIEWTTSAFPDFNEERRFRVRNEGALVFPIAGKSSPWNWKVGVNYEYQSSPVQQTKASDVEGYFALTYAK